MTHTPLVSVITPTYNTAHLLAETIDSVLAQDYPNFEYIVLDDGSKDNTVEVLHRYDGDSRVRWETHPNMGEANTVNKGFNLAAGDLIAVVSADDPVLPGWISAMVAVMQANPDVLVAYPDWKIIDQHSQYVSDPPQFDYDYVAMLNWHYCYIGPGAFIRRKAIGLETGRDTSFRFVSDYDFWLRVGLHGCFVRVRQSLATWRAHTGSQSISYNGPAMAAEHVRVIEKYFNRPNLPPEIASARREALAMANYIAALKCMTSSARKEARHYALRAMWLYPALNRYTPLETIFTLPAWVYTVRMILLPGFIDRGITWLWHKLHGKP